MGSLDVSLENVVTQNTKHRYEKYDKNKHVISMIIKTDEYIYMDIMS